MIADSLLTQFGSIRSRYRSIFVYCDDILFLYTPPTVQSTEDQELVECSHQRILFPLPDPIPKSISTTRVMRSHCQRRVLPALRGREYCFLRRHATTRSHREVQESGCVISLMCFHGIGRVACIHLAPEEIPAEPLCMRRIPTGSTGS